MKKILSFVFCLIGLVTYSHGQRQEKNCGKLPTKEQVKQKLRARPSYEISPRDFSLKCNVDDTVKRLLISQFLEKAQSKEKKAPHYKSGVIRAIGFLDMKNASPTLEKALNDTNYFSNRYDVKLALARLGNPALQRELIGANPYNAQLEDDEWIDALTRTAGVLTYIGTQESIYALREWLDTSKQYMYSSNGALGKSAYRAIALLSDILLNPDFRQKIKGVDLSGYQGNNDFIEDCRQWLIKNKGKYIINRDIYFM